MQCARISCESQIGARGLHFIFEGGNAVIGHENIVGAVTDHDFRAHAARGRFVCRAQCSVEADDADQWQARACRMQRHRATEAIADRGDAPRVHGIVILKVFQRSTQPRIRLAHVPEHTVHQPGRGVRVVRDLTTPVHVDGQRRKPKLGQHPCPATEIVVQSPPFVDDQNTWPWRAALSVIGKKALQFGAIGTQLDGFSVQVGFRHDFPSSKYTSGHSKWLPSLTQIRVKPERRTFDSNSGQGCGRITGK